MPPLQPRLVELSESISFRLFTYPISASKKHFIPEVSIHKTHACGRFLWKPLVINELCYRESDKNCTFSAVKVLQLKRPFS